METVSPKERYVIKIDSSMRTKDDLFSRITDAAYLGYSSFSGWDAFNEMLLDRLASSDILIEILNEDLSGLTKRDRDIYLEILVDAVREHPDKLKVH